MVFDSVVRLLRPLLLASCCFASRPSMARVEIRGANQPAASKPSVVRAAGWQKYFDGTEYIRPEKKVGVLQEVKRALLFDNLPFLRLKQGDKLMRGQAWRSPIEVFKSPSDKRDSYFVFHQNRYFQLSAYDDHGKLRLIGPTESLLFDWDVSLPLALSLGRQVGSSNIELQPQMFAAMRDEVRKQFPLIALGEPPVLKVPHLQGEGAGQIAVIESVVFDPYKDAVFHQRLSIGHSRFLLERKVLLQGPRRVEREDFEGFEGGSGINAPGSYHPDPAVAALRRKEFDRMRHFQRVIEPFLPAPLPRDITGEPAA